MCLSVAKIQFNNSVSIYHFNTGKVKQRGGRKSARNLKANVAMPFLGECEHTELQLNTVTGNWTKSFWNIVMIKTPNFCCNFSFRNLWF